MEKKKNGQFRIVQTAQSIRNGAISCRKLVENSLFLISQIDNDAKSWAWVERDKVLNEADKLDILLKQGFDLGPLHGIPIGVKDIIDVFDYPTACGSKLWERAFARRDAFVVQRLREAGAILLGKTVTTPYASFDPSIAKNPWNPLRTPGGSSSGSAVAVANNMCLASLGTQTGGSIIRPAAYCGISACKPSYGFTSLDGVLPLAKSMDHIGPMAHSVEDLGIVMQAIAWKKFSSISNRLIRRGEKVPPVLGVLPGFFEKKASQDVMQTFSLTVSELEHLGVSYTQLFPPISLDEMNRNHRIIMAVEAASFHQIRFRERPDDYPPKISELIEEGMKYSALEYQGAKEFQIQQKSAWNNLLRKVDAVVMPATTSIAPSIDTTGDPSFNCPWSLTGMPVVTFPIGRSNDGLPIGIQMIGKMHEDFHLLNTSKWCQQMIDRSI